MAPEGAEDSSTDFVEHRNAEIQRARANGFTTVPELKGLSCRADFVAPFSLPTEALLFEPSPDLVVSQFENGDQERKIHCNVELQANELERLVALQREAANQGLKFFPSVTSMATRFLSHCRMDVKNALKCMQTTQQWRAAYFAEGPLADESVIDDLRHGILYFSGRDRDLRPVLVVRGRRIPQAWYKDRRMGVDKLIRLLVFCMEYLLRYMTIPGRVENLSVIVDLKGVSVAQVSLSALSEIHKVMSHHYSGRVFRFYVVSMPYALGMLAGVAKSLLTDRQKEKLAVLKDAKELQKHFALHQLESDLGGSRPPIEKFYPFPLPPGPFDAGCAKGPDEAAIPGAHLLLTDQNVIGDLWDPLRCSGGDKSSGGPPRPLKLAGLGPPRSSRSTEKGCSVADSSPHSTASTDEEELAGDDVIGREPSSSSGSSSRKDWEPCRPECPAPAARKVYPLSASNKPEMHDTDICKGLRKREAARGAFRGGRGKRFTSVACCCLGQRVTSPRRVVSL